MTTASECCAIYMRGQATRSYHRRERRTRWTTDNAAARLRRFGDGGVPPTGFFWTNRGVAVCKTYVSEFLFD